MNWEQALKTAIREREEAEAAFLYADAEHCDIAIYRLQAAEEQVRLVIRDARRDLGYTLNALPPGRLALWEALPASKVAAADTLFNSRDGASTTSWTHNSNISKA